MLWCRTCCCFGSCLRSLEKHDWYCLIDMSTVCVWCTQKKNEWIVSCWWRCVQRHLNLPFHGCISLHLNISILLESTTSPSLDFFRLPIWMFICFTGGHVLHFSVLYHATDPLKAGGSKPEHAPQNRGLHQTCDINHHIEKWYIFFQNFWDWWEFVKISNTVFMSTIPRSHN